MFIVADELAVGVSGQGGLAGAGQTEEDSGVTFCADVSGAVHGEYALLGQDVVHDGEDGLLDFACVLGAADDCQMLFVVQQDRSFGVGAVAFGDALEAGSSDDGVVGFKAYQLVSGGAAQQVGDEQVLACQFVYDTEVLGVLGVSACKAVENEDFAILQISNNLFVQRIELRLRDGTVYLAPCNVIVYAFGVNDELIVCGTAGVLAGLNDQSAGLAQQAFAATQSVFGQLCVGQVAINSRGVDDAQIFNAVSFHLWYLL